MKTSIGAILAVLFLLGIFLLAKFPPSLSQVMVIERSLAHKSQPTLHETFPLPSLVGALYPDSVLYSFKWHALVSVSLGVIALLLMGAVGEAAIMLVISPWFIKSALFDTASILTLALAEALLLGYKKGWKYLTPVITLLLAFTSLTGLIFALAFLIMLAAENFRSNWKLVVCGVLVVGATLLMAGRYQAISSQIRANFDNYNFARAKFDVDQRVRMETKINNYQDIIPLGVKRIPYNKLYFVYLHTFPTFFNVLSWDKIFSPSQEGVTVARGLWGETGFNSLFFWQASLILLGLIAWKNISALTRRIVILCTLAGLVGCALTPAGVFEQAGIVLLVATSLLASQGFKLLVKNKFALIVFLLVAVCGLGSGYYYFLSRELSWRDNRPFVMYNLVRLVKDHPNTPVVVSNMIGPSQYFYAWEFRLDPNQFLANTDENPTLDNVHFYNFDFANNKDHEKGIYIGFPGQFLGNRAIKNSNDFSPNELPGDSYLLDYFNFEKHVSYGNGDQIWVVQVN